MSVRTKKREKESQKLAGSRQQKPEQKSKEERNHIWALKLMLIHDNDESKMKRKKEILGMIKDFKRKRKY